MGFDKPSNWDGFGFQYRNNIAGMNDLNIFEDDFRYFGRRRRGV